MSERDRSFGADNSNLGQSYLGFSQLNSKQLVQSHIKSIMPSLRGGKQEEDVRYIFIRVHQNVENRLQLESKIRPILEERFGTYCDYRKFKDKAELLSEDIKDGDLYYIFVGEDLVSWAQKFSRQERDESNDKRIIHVVEFLKEKKYASKVKQRSKMRRDQNDRIFYEANLDHQQYLRTLKEVIFEHMEQKLKVRLLKEGDNARKLALNAKYKVKKEKRQRLYLYVENTLMEHLASLNQKYKKRSAFKWTKMVNFLTFKDILIDVKAREIDCYDEQELKNSYIATQNILSQGSIMPTGSRLLDRSKSNIQRSGINFDKSRSNLNLDRSRSNIKSPSTIGGGQSSLTSPKSIKDISLKKLDVNPRTTDFNYIICMNDFEEKQKLYQFVVSQKKDNWKLIECNSENLNSVREEVDLMMKNMQKQEKDAQKEEYERIVKSKILYILSEEDDMETYNNFVSMTNHFCNMEHVTYADSLSLQYLLNKHGVDKDNFVVVVLRDQNTPEQDVFFQFSRKNKRAEGDIQNLKAIYKRNHIPFNDSLSVGAMGLSTNSKIGSFENSDEWLRALMENRDRFFHPFSGLVGRNVYLLFRYDQDYLLDDKMRERIVNTRRLQKATYRDPNYLNSFLKTLRKKKDSAIVITDDSSMYQAQKVVKNFDEVFIMNITDRKKVKDEIKLMAWGTKQQIYDLIFKEIPDTEGKLERQQYKDLPGEPLSIERPERIMPKDIQFKTANNITVRISEHEESPDSAVMQNNLDHYFNEQIRFQYYDKPTQIRLVDKVEEPLTFIICRDEPEQLDYMKKIAHKEKVDLRQEYILYTKNPDLKKYEQLYKDSKYTRFRFVSNSWKQIQLYIIGAYQRYRGIINDEIYEDELIHIFYHPKDAQLVRYFKTQLSNYPASPRTKFYPVQFMDQVAQEESPHHIYYLIINQKNPDFNTNKGRQEIFKIQQSLHKNKIAKKKIEMLVFGANQMVRKQDNVKGNFEDYKMTMQFVAKTVVLPTRVRSIKPHIIINDNASSWYYFLEKYSYLKKYHFHAVKSKEESLDLIRKIRTVDQDAAYNGKSTKSLSVPQKYQVDPGAHFWILTNNKQDLLDSTYYSAQIEGGRDISMIYHGSDVRDARLVNNKLLFSDPSRQEVQAFILNSFKRSNHFFSPESLRNTRPVIAMSTQTAAKVPINFFELQRWKEDFEMEDFVFENINHLKSIDENKMIILVQDIEEENRFRKAIENMYNVFRIIFDSNQFDRKKAHNKYKIIPNKRDLFTGYYPLQVRNYLQFLRYNMRNPPFKIEKKIKKDLIQIYWENGLQLNQRQVKNLKLQNNSIVMREGFNKQDLRRVINISRKYPSYDTMFLVSKETAREIEKFPEKADIQYLVFDKQCRNKPSKNINRLVTDERDQYVTYLFNLPQNRYQKAKKLKKPLKVMYQLNSTLQEKGNQLKKISRRNKSFSVDGYNQVSDLKAYQQPITVLANPNSMQDHIRLIGHRQNITYFILDDKESRNLTPNTKFSQYFITKMPKDQLYGYFNNAAIEDQAQNKNTMPIRPIQSIPALLSAKLKTSTPLQFKNVDLNKISFFPPFNKPVQLGKLYKSTNFIDQNNTKFFKLPTHCKSDQPYKLSPEDPTMCPPVKSSMPIKNPLSVHLDYPPAISLNKFGSVADMDSHQILPVLEKPKPKEMDKKLAVIFPLNNQFNEIVRVLKSNLHPKHYKMEQFPYRTQYEFESYYQHIKEKFGIFDKIIVFIEPKMKKYTQALNTLQGNMPNKLSYFIFDDDFDKNYSKFVKFLIPGYEMRRQETPYINKTDPEFWASTSIYNIMVPLNKKKRYDSLRSDNVIVLPYSSDDDIINQLHRQDEFLIIICDKKNYHLMKKYPRYSPRCILVVEDTQEIGEDEIVLHKYPLKALYYGSDVINYLAKYRIPTRKIPYKQDTMKVLFFKPGEEQIATQEQFSTYEKVPFLNNEDLFIKIIERFKSSQNFRFPDKRGINSLIKLNPKIFMAKQTSYMNKYKNQYSSLDGVQEFKTSFKNQIKPSQYAHLPLKQYDNVKDLVAQLDKEQAPCMVYVDVNRREFNKVVKDYKDRHLFIMMHNLLDRWIMPNGYLVDSEQLYDKDKLGRKQILFTRMFNQEVFDTYNDMGYYYLSNAARFDTVRRITFMTREALSKQYHEKNNLLMIVFVEHTDRKFIPTQFYDSEYDTSKDDRVKLIFIHTEFVDNQDILYIKYNEIDPVIKHINRVELASRVNYCLYPNSDVGGILWHKFANKFKGYQPVEYYGLSDMDRIAQDIKGKFRKVYVICQKDQENFIQNVLEQYSIKTKQKTEEQVKFLHISESDQKSFLMPISRIAGDPGGSYMKGMNSGFNEPHYADQSPEKASHQVQTNYQMIKSRDGLLATGDNIVQNKRQKPKEKPTKISSQQKIQKKTITTVEERTNVYPLGNSPPIGGLKFTDNEDENSQKFQTVGQPIDIKMNSSNKNFGHLNIEDVIQSKNFILSVNEKLKETFPVGNFYASKVTYFNDLDQLEHPEAGQSQLIISNQKYGDIQKLITENPDMFVIYVSNDMPSTQKGNTLIIEEKQIPSLIRKLEGSRKEMVYKEEGEEDYELPEVAQGFNLKNIDQYRMVRIVYDEDVDKDTKKQIFITSLKHKNLVPVLYQDIDKIKEYMKEDNSLLLIMMSKDPPGLEEDLKKDNYVMVRKRKIRMIVPKKFDSTIDGLSTILEEQQQSQISHLDHNLDDNIDTFLKMIEKNPQKNKRILMKVESGNQLEEQDEIEKDSFKGIQNEHENITKLNVHSNIRPQNYLDEDQKYKIKQRLDGGVIVVVVEKEFTEKVKDLLKKFNILIQEYSHAINLDQSIRERKGKVTIVVVKKDMLNDIRKIKQQFPMIIFVVLNSEQEDIPDIYSKYISVEIAKIGELQPIVADIYEENERVKYMDQGKISRFDNRRVSTVQVGNSERFSVGFNNTRAKKAFVFYKSPENEQVRTKLHKILNHISFIAYKDFEDAQKKLNSYGGYQSVLIANDNQIPMYEDYVLKKKDQTYIIKFNPPEDLRDNPKVKKNILLSTYSNEELQNFLIRRFEKNSSINDFGQSTFNQKQKMPQGKRYTPKYQPSAFGTTPRFSSPSNNFVPLKNDPNFSKRLLKSSSRSSKMLRGGDTQLRSIDSRTNDYSSYYHH